MLVAIVCALLLAAVVAAAPAAADSPPSMACGTTIVTSCSQTVHYSDLDTWFPPPGPGDNCPAYLEDDFGHVVATGNGVEHVTINKAGDFWSTVTFTGDATITLYAPDNVDVTFDQDGNVAATPIGPPDAVVTGHLTQWFGASDNKQSGEFGQTTTVQGVDQDGNAITIHMTQHANWTPGSEPFDDPPHHAQADFSC
jgi:hypothetical protein